MRRIVVGFMGTLSALVLLFSYHTSLGASSTASGGANSDADPTADSTADPTGGSGAGTSTPDGTTSGSQSGSSSTESGSTQPGSTESGSTASGSTSSGSSSSGSSKSATYTGDSADTRWGPVQVRITVKGGKITKSEAVVYPTGNGRDQEINAYAVPALNQEAVQAQSSRIDALSGATVTSDGYIRSLQSAIDKANL